MGVPTEQKVTVRVKALGWLRGLTGASESEVSFSGRSLSDFFRTMEGSEGCAHMDSNLFLVLVNGKSVDCEGHQLSTGDRITLLPVVSGG
jgi:molybdopterin converting factor small subunit